MIYTASQLETFTRNIFIKMGSTAQDAETAAKVLISADLRGVDSHGVARLSGYVRLWEKERLNATPQVKIIHETPSTAVVDGDLGAGLVVAPKAMAIAIEKARTAGSGWVAVQNSNHFGIAGYHSMMALDHDMIGFAMTNASPLVAPTFSKSKFLGTNPISVAIPAGNQPPLVIDMATTSVANGKLEVLQRKNMSMPEGWAQDENGNPTTDAAILKKGGAMLPLGSDRTHGSHKGYCLSSWVDIFSAVLSGANYGPWVPPFVAYIDPISESVGKGIGHFVGAWRVDAFRPADEFKHHMDNWIETFRKAVPVDGEEKVLIPGDPEREITAQRLKDGIDLLQPVVEDLMALGQKMGVEL
ncbi:LDH2 family malate/lactate/ureidoglycolate dehydrogenase [Breznakibacter xylanolyticus]|uniref:LDH2 family malate/lactate/ureidoglycolate dehydrogenase n=1 Tax=Breznakibacter xylanolyticus TaxID=990 RepID=A0A2W7NFB4_9BACT|nr:Ldh family oxidoreductase [Breznakibacter xylanolyticus]MBN2743776.1 Ldh family oxidoreductase [Marinilabiliaceae bacterium]PZX18173.1 LDH2 family malate/lactate/ureidoglycolate dehydrogenase [Breznakibacter xylanolyticus]